MKGFSYSNVDREMSVYGYDAMIKSHCRMCHGGCGVFVYMKDGRIAKIAGDPESDRAPHRPRFTSAPPGMRMLR